MADQVRDNTSAIQAHLLLYAFGNGTDDLRIFLSLTQMVLKEIYGREFSEQETAQVVFRQLSRGTLVVGRPGRNQIAGLATYAGQEVDWHYTMNFMPDVS